MGLTYLEIEVGNPSDPEVTERVEFLIDSGAVYFVVSSDILERLAISRYFPDGIQCFHKHTILRQSRL